MYYKFTRFLFDDFQNSSILQRHVTVDGTGFPFLLQIWKLAKWSSTPMKWAMKSTVDPDFSAPCCREPPDEFIRDTRSQFEKFENNDLHVNCNCCNVVSGYLFLKNKKSIRIISQGPRGGRAPGGRVTSILAADLLSAHETDRQLASDQGSLPRALPPSSSPPF